MKKPKIIFILGPTGVGKSEFAVRLAENVKGEIISCDSMQVYKGMAILSQYPSPELRKKIPHHLIGFLSPSKEWSAADFTFVAGKAVDDIIKRGKTPIIAGGTGLYARAFMEGLFPSPPKDEDLREKIYNEAVKSGNAKLYAKLKEIDPLYAAKIHPNDTRRIVRALEVYHLTGKTISEQHLRTKGLADKYDMSVFILNRNRGELYERIDRRVDDMFEKGVVSEVKKLARKKLSKTAKAALGFAEIGAYLKGELGAEEAKALLKMNTRHYAKRQLTWFRREKAALWIDMSAPDKSQDHLWKKL